MKRLYLVLVTVLMLLYIVADVLFETVLSQYAFPYLFVIPLFFIIFGSVAFKFAESSFVGNGVKIMMGIKSVRLLLSMIYLFVYAFVVGTNVVAFLITFLTFFFVYLVMETLLFAQLNKR